jgi:hypothetical protein
MEPTQAMPGGVADSSLPVSRVTWTSLERWVPEGRP